MRRFQDFDTEIELVVNEIDIKGEVVWYKDENLNLKFWSERNFE